MTDTQASPPTRRWWQFWHWWVLTEGGPDASLYMGVTLIAAVLGIAGAAIYGWTSPGGVDGWQILALSLVVGLAALLVAGLLGYLFGIPVSIGESRRYFRANTSLEQISEWLTKIVIGVGLVELRTLGSALNDVGENIAAATDLQAGKQLFIGLILLESVCGFIFFYLWSRIHMPRLFIRAEVKAFREVQDRAELERTIAATELEIDRARRATGPAPGPAEDHHDVSG